MEQSEQASEVNNDKVICPNCCNQFRAVPVNVQALLLASGHEPPFVAPPQPAGEQTMRTILGESAHSLEWFSRHPSHNDVTGFQSKRAAKLCRELRAAIALRQPTSEVVERAWLVEWSGYGYGPQWWGFNFEPKRCASWCEDANNAIRFSRKADAERIRLHILALEGTNSEDRKRSISVTEHEWHGAAPPIRSAGG